MRYFTMTFFQVCWDLIKEVVMGVFMIFMLEVSLKKALNVISIALISKKFEAVDVKDFRPISLVSGVDKIIAKS
jgi:hypothetical protein